MLLWVGKAAVGNRLQNRSDTLQASFWATACLLALPQYQCPCSVGHHHTMQEGESNCRPSSSQHGVPPRGCFLGIPFCLVSMVNLPTLWNSFLFGFLYYVSAGIVRPTWRHHIWHCTGVPMSHPSPTPLLPSTNPHPDTGQSLPCADLLCSAQGGLSVRALKPTLFDFRALAMTRRCWSAPLRQC